MTAQQPYEVQLPDGTVFRVTSLAEMVQLKRELEAAQTTPATPPLRTPVVNGVKQHDAASQLVIDQLGEERYAEELQVLTIIQGQKKPILTANIMRGLGWSEDQHGRLGSRVAGIGRICKAAGISTEALIIREGNHKNGITYRSGAMLVKLDLPPVPQGAR